jgi:hypothetical protein
MRPALLVVAIAACASDPDGVSTQIGELHVDAPIFLFYGVYRPNPGWEPDARSASTHALLNAPGEVVLAMNRELEPPNGPPSPEFDSWRASSGLVAQTFSRGEFEMIRATRGRDGLFALVKFWLDTGFSYVALDEINDGALGWRNGGGDALHFRELLDDLAAAGFDRRIILFVNSYNLPGRFGEWSEVLRACRDHCRVLASEIYLSTGNVLRSHAGNAVAESPGHCTRSLDCLGGLARQLDEAAPGLASRMITVLGLSDPYNEGDSYGTKALCGMPGARGALYYQYARLHVDPTTRFQPGVGGYSLPDVRRELHPTWGPRAQADCLVSLDRWSWPDAH